MSKTVILEEPNAIWPLIAVQEISSLFALLDCSLVSLEHIGSTSIPNIVAKPVIDLLGEVVTLDDIDCKKSLLEDRGYVWRGEHGINERRYITKPQVDGKSELLHIHLFPVGHQQVARHARPQPRRTHRHGRQTPRDQSHR